MAKTKKRPDGLYEIVRSVGAQRKHFYGKTKKEAELKFLAALQEEEEGPLFDIVADEWWEDFTKHCSPNSMRAYNSALDRAKDAFGQSRIKSISPKDISQWVKALAEQDFAKKTVKNHLIVIGDIFEYAREEYDLVLNPAKGIRIPKGLRQQKRKLPSEEDDRAMMQAIHLPFGLFPFLAKYTGARRGEILGLRFGDIDRDNKTIHIERTVYFDGNTPKLKLPKTEAGIRTIPLLSVVQDVLPKGKPNDYIFGGKKLLTQSQMRVAYANLQKKAGFSATPHQWRHLYATILYDADIPAKDAQVIMGHANIATTLDIYTHVKKERLAAATQKLDSFTTKNRGA